jgi:hypothetical protein
VRGKRRDGGAGRRGRAGAGLACEARRAAGGPTDQKPIEANEPVERGG